MGHKLANGPSSNETYIKTNIAQYSDYLHTFCLETKQLIHPNVARNYFPYLPPPPPPPLTLALALFILALPKKTNYPKIK